MEVHGRKMEEQDSDKDTDDNKQYNTDGDIADNYIASNRTETSLDEETLTSPSTENCIEVKSCMLTEENGNEAEHLSFDNVEVIASNAYEIVSRETRDIFCDPCQNDGNTLIATGYCVDCDEYLCEICYKAHCRPSITRHHVLLDNDKMPTRKKCESSYNTDTCKEHFGQVIHHFCKTHEQLRCSVCMENAHANCTNTESLATILDRYSGDREVTVALESLRSITFDAKHMKTLISSNRHAVDMYLDKALSDIPKLMSEKEELFDKLKYSMRSMIQGNENKDKTNLTALERKIDTMLFDLQTLEDRIKDLKTKPKDAYKLFVSVKNTKMKILECTNELKNIETQTEITRYRFLASNNIDKLRKPDFFFGELKYLQDIISELKEVINVSSENDMSTSRISGMIALPVHLLVCIDETNRTLILVNISDNIITSRKVFDNSPSDLTKVSNRTVAVLFAEINKIFIVSILTEKELSTTKEIDIGHKCESIYCIE